MPNRVRILTVPDGDRVKLTDTIGAFIDQWNDDPRPFTWTKDADEILGKIQRAKTKTGAQS